MNYNVAYSIDLNEKQASAGLTKFLNTATSVLPKVDKRFTELNKKLTTTLGLVQKIQRELREINSIKININSKEAVRDLDSIKRRLDKIKSKKVNVTVSEKGRGGTRKSAGSMFSKSKGSSGMFAKQFGATSALSAGGIPFATTLGAGMIGLGMKNLMGEAIQFQHIMTSVKSILRTTDGDASTFSKRFGEMSMNMRQLGVDTKFSAVEIGEASRFLAMAGMNVETIDKSMRGIINMAAIGDFDLGEMADVVTNIMTGYGVASTQVNDATDMMSAITSRANVNVMEMGESMKYASNYMRVGGIAFEEGAAAIGIMGNAGIKGSLAGTSLRAMLIRLISPTTKAKKIIDGLTKTSDGLKVSFTKMVTVGGKTKEIIKPLSEIFADLKDANASTSDINKIFDKVGGSGALALLTNIEKLKALTYAAKFSGGTADFLAEEKMRTVVGLSQQLRSKFLDLGQTMFNTVTPQVKTMMEDLLGWLKSDDADKVFTSISRGVSNILSGIKNVVSYMKNNWNWLQYVFGGMIAKNVIRRGVGMAGGIANSLGALGGAAGARRFAQAKNLMSGGKAVAGVKALGAGLSSMVVGGTLAAGLGLVAFSIYKIYTNSLMLSNIKDELANWSISRTGMNTSALDALQLKLSNINNTTKEAIDNKFKLSAGGKKVFEATEAARTWKDLYLSDKNKSDVTESVRNFALGSGGMTNINDIFSAAFRMKDPKKGLKSLNMLSAYGYGGSNKSLYSYMSGSGDSFSKDPRKLTQQIESSHEYKKTLSDAAKAKLKQGKLMFAGLTGGEDAAWTAINAGLGDKFNSSGIQSKIQGKGLNREELLQVFRTSGESIQKWISVLGENGLMTAQTESLLKKIGVHKMIESQVDSTGGGPNSITSAATKAAQDAALAGQLTGTGRASSSGGRVQIVNIRNLMNVESAEVHTEGDIDALRGKIAQVLTDAVNDFQIGNTI